MPISLDKIPQEIRADAEQAKVTLQKGGIFGQLFKVALCLDYSGSMSSLYANGTVQDIAEKILGLATQVDDDGDFEVFGFGHDGFYAGTLSMNDYKGGINRLFENRRMGTTNYAGGMRAVRQYYDLDSDSATSHIPILCVFLTDGRPDSKADAKGQLVASSGVPIFWTFGGIGDTDPMVIPDVTSEQPKKRGLFGRRSSPVVTNPESQFAFLRSLDTMDGRKVDNASYFPAPTAAAITMDNILHEVPSWIPTIRQMGMLV